MKKEDKRGSHISFIISFILFISFLIFFIGILNPFEKVETGKSSLLKHLENEIIKETSAEVIVVSALEDLDSDCSEINSLLNMGNYKTQQQESLLKIYFSDEFLTNPNPLSCTSPSGYKIGLIRNETYVFESKVLKLNNTDYDNVKKSFEIPETNDFEFSLLDIDEIPIIKTKSEETPPTEVLAELIPIIYFDENADIKNGYIKVVIW